MRGREWHAYGVAVWCLVVSGCTAGPGPLHRCSVVELHTREYTGDGCGCADEDPAHWETRFIGSWAGLVAPPGSFPPSAAMSVRGVGADQVVVSHEDGSAFVGLFEEGADIDGRTVEVEVEGSRYSVRLDEFSAARPVTPAMGDERFPAGALVVEDPTETLAFRARVVMSLGHLVLFPPRSGIEWVEPTPAPGTIVERSWPGREGDYYGVIGLNAGRAFGCWRFGGPPPGRCECAIENRASANCRFEPELDEVTGVVELDPVTPIDIDAGPPDAGVDAGEPDANLGVPF